MSSSETKKKVRIQTDNLIHEQTIKEEDEYQNQKLVPYAKIPTIMHIKDLNAFSYRPNSDIDVDCSTPYDRPNQNINLVHQQLDRWKKDLSSKTAQNADELRRMRENHENSLKFNQNFPQINMEIIDSITRIPNDRYIQTNQNEDKFSNYGGYQNSYSPKEGSSQKQKNYFQYNSSSKSMTQFGNNEYSQASFSSQNTLNNKIYTGSGNKKANFIQSNESIQREVNKKLVNNLIFSRIQRTLEDNQITARQNKANKNEEQANINKQRADDIFKTETSHFSISTLANFKNLMQSFRRSNNLIEYEHLQKQLQTFLNRPTGIFEGSDQKNELFTSFTDEKEERYHQKHMEKILLDNYKQLREDITKRTNEIKDMRQFANDLQSQLTDINEKTRLYILQIDKEIEAKEKANEPVKKQAIQITKAKKEIQKILEEKEEKLAVFKAQKDQINSLFKQNSESLIISEKDIKNYKEKKNITRNMLKQLYFMILKSDKSLQKQSMVWIIRSLLNINEDVTQSDIFPAVLDNKSIQYLIEYSALEQNLDHIQNKLKSNNDDPNSQYYNDAFDQTYLNKQHQYSISELKSKVQKIAKKQNLKIRKPIFTQNNMKNDYILQWENTQEQNQTEEITFNLNKVPPSKIDLINQNKDAREEIKQIRIQQKKMKETESNRLIDQYLLMKDENKVNELKQILNILFGELEGEEYFKNYQKKYQHLMFQIKNNKTFTFNKSNLTSRSIKDEPIKEEIRHDGQVGSQTILKYRKGLNDDENKQIDQFALVKSVGKTFHKNKQNELIQNQNQKRLELPPNIIQRHNNIKKIVTEGENQYFNKLQNIQPLSLTNLESYDKPKSSYLFHRQNQYSQSYGNLPSSLTNLSTESPLINEQQQLLQRNKQNNNLYFLTQRNPTLTTLSELESPLKSQASFRLQTLQNSQKKLYN